MLNEKRPPGPWWRLLPAGGMGLFAVLYGVAAALYPGGSPADKTAPGFSWLHNYWCNLLTAVAINGQPNPAQPVALLAMGVLCLSLMLFWYCLPPLFQFGARVAGLVRSAGILSMVAAGFLSGEQHDLMITIACLLGVVALGAAFAGLYRTRRLGLLGLGALCLLLLGVNNYVYYSQHFIEALPVVQKITFVLFLLWFSLLSGAVYKQGSLRATYARQ
ncbi:hypothetical protein ACFQ48_16335 [Hymenobacter caeli]|uniref:DUF998 domain-containing protein n=1 Tax=Hymenobacter caeli TaxID=2735894 RepID=A0ABX2FWD0_9BACT|nr:hypothetical protein [Hymenobacter caeli]NRT20690.1 hypothetical protein [Hymenobacter caeli]